MKIITLLTCLFFLQINAQVTKNDANTENFLNGSSVQRSFNYTTSDFAGFTTSNVDRVTISVEFTIEDLEFFFEARNEDLAIRLTSPTGSVVDLVYDSNGIFTGSTQTATFTGTTLSFTSTTVLFDDNATSAVSSNSDPQSGTFRPEEQLSLFQNETAIGNWVLELGDGFANGFGDQITYNSSEINIYPSTTLSINNQESISSVYLKSTLIKDDLEIKTEDNSLGLINIYDSLGKLVITANNQNIIDTDKLESGIYIIEIFNQQSIKRSVIRFIKI